MTIQFLISIAIHLPFESEVTVLEMRLVTSVILPVHNLWQRPFVFIRRSLKFYLRWKSL